MQHLAIDLSGPTERTSSARVLIVDNDPSVRQLHATALRRCGYNVATAMDGVYALERLANECFDLMLTDRTMPRLDGASVVLALRSAGSRIPIVMVSGSLAFRPLPAGVSREISAAILKPARITEVLAAVARALRPAPAGPPQLPGILRHAGAALH